MEKDCVWNKAEEAAAAADDGGGGEAKSVALALERVEDGAEEGGEGRGGGLERGGGLAKRGVFVLAVVERCTGMVCDGRCCCCCCCCCGAGAGGGCGNMFCRCCGEGGVGVGGGGGLAKAAEADGFGGLAAMMLFTRTRNSYDRSTLLCLARIAKEAARTTMSGRSNAGRRRHGPWSHAAEPQPPPSAAVPSFPAVLKACDDVFHIGP